MDQLKISVSSLPGHERSLYDHSIKMAYSQESLRPYLLPIIKEAARSIGLNKLKQLHEKRGTFAILSAYRPLSKSENQDRHGELIRDLQIMGYRKWYDAKGYWTHTEKSLLVPKMNFGDAMQMGHKYDQDAVVFKSMDGIIGIYYMADRTVQLVGPDIEMEAEDDDAITNFRNTGLTYDLYDERIPFRGPVTKKYLEQKGYADDYPGLMAM
jgi:hypothetical protein